MIQCSLTMHPGHTPGQLKQAAARALGVRLQDIGRVEILRRSIDARKKPDVRLVYRLALELRRGEGAALRRNRQLSAYQPPKPYLPPKCQLQPQTRPVVVGFGPAGMFAALVLARAGLRPLVLERGDEAAVRKEKVDAFWQSGKLDPNSNVQFGEGGAGTFSDGKLNTGTHDLRNRWILQQLAAFGAGPEILYDAKPHIGTDVLIEVVQRLRAELLRLGAEIRFCTQLTDFHAENGQLRQIVCSDGTVLDCRHLILAIGHSARDTFRLLEHRGLHLEPKAFSMGVRIEHPQSLINESQYAAANPAWLPAADYKLSVHLPDGGSAYTFCMCPGGYVVAAASQEGGVVTNGMSYSGRSGENANAALLVTLHPEDFPAADALAGMRWQEELEQAAFAAGGSNYHAPAQLVGDFLAGQPSKKLGLVQPTYRPGVTLCDLHTFLPRRITEVLEQAIPALGQRLAGFDHPEAVLTAPESRSSSPVRIVRDEAFHASVHGIYPCGEGAGYAGGIMSAAADGIRCAEALVRSLQAEAD